MTGWTAGLTGWRDEAPVAPPAYLVERLDALAARVSALAGADVDWGALLTARSRLAGPAGLGLAELNGQRRGGRRSANGSCRLLRATDGWVAINLSRPDDLELVPALTGRAACCDPWAGVERMAAGQAAGATVARARLVGLPASALARPAPRVRGCRVSQRWGRAGGDLRGARVVDLSALWAGPLAASILVGAGAEVVKVESLRRPDSARSTPAFYESLHHPDQEVVALDLAAAGGQDSFRDLLAGADVVIEASRPRALEQLGCGPLQLSPRPGRVWLSITGHGRHAPARDWVAFGDDAAVAGGLVAWDRRGEPVFCADAIADPVTGLVGAEAVLSSLDAGGGELIDLAMSRAAGSMVAGPLWGPPR